MYIAVKIEGWLTFDYTSVYNTNSNLIDRFIYSCDCFPVGAFYLELVGIYSMFLNLILKKETISSIDKKQH